MSDEKYIDVLLVKPMKPPEVIQIEDCLEAMQELVGGDLEEYMPFKDDVAIVCKVDGKCTGEQLNRGIYDENGELRDIIAGNFFVSYAPMESEDYLSLSEEQIKEYTEKFRYPEQFFMDRNGKVIGKKLMREAPDLER